MFFTLWCSQSSSVVLHGIMLCLDSESDLKYCLGAARKKKSLLQVSGVEMPEPVRGI